MNIAILPVVMLSTLAALAGCTVDQPSRGDNAYCAQLFDQLDRIEFLPQPAMGFDFRQMQLSRIRQARCLTFTRNLAGVEALPESSAQIATSGPAFARPVAIQAGVVTNSEDVSRAVSFFAEQGYRARSVGSPGLGTRVYVEARTIGDTERIVALAQQAGFVGPYPSRYVLF